MNTAILKDDLESSTSTISVLDKGYVRLVDLMGSDLSVANAARASYAKESQEFSSADERLIAFLAREGHMSPFRHAFLTFEFKAPLMVARQHWKYVVGSDHCQPEGTLVSKVIGQNPVDGRRSSVQLVPIEDLKINDKVLSYGLESKHLYREGKKITNIQTRSIKDEIITIKSNNNVSRYTKEHPCVVKLGDSLQGKYVVYLMRRGDSYRIGCTKGYRGSSVGLRVRFTREKPDSIWILKTFDSREAAEQFELLTSYNYGIPMTLFVGTEKGKSQIVIDAFWNSMGDMTHRAKDLLQDLALDITCPLFVINNFSQSLKTQTIFVTAACNLISGMLVLQPEDDHRGFEKKLWHPISNIELTPYTGKVYSLTVADAHTYIADGIMTHNCMDSWNESSRRYVTSDPEFYVPDTLEWRSAPESSKQGSGAPLGPSEGLQLTKALEYQIGNGEFYYDWAMKLGVAPELARLFLPAYGMYVYYRWSCSLQSLCHFLKERLGEDAQSEIQNYAVATYRLSYDHFPACFAALIGERDV